MFDQLRNSILCLLSLALLQGCADKQTIEALETEVQAIQEEVKVADVKLASITAEHAVAKAKATELEEKLEGVKDSRPDGITRQDVMKLKGELAEQSEENALIQQELDKL